MDLDDRGHIGHGLGRLCDPEDLRLDLGPQDFEAVSGCEPVPGGIPNWWHFMPCRGHNAQHHDWCQVLRCGHMGELLRLWGVVKHDHMVVLLVEHRAHCEGLLITEEDDLMMRGVLEVIQNAPPTLNSSCLCLGGQQGLLGLPPGLASSGLDGPGHRGLVHRLLFHHFCHSPTPIEACTVGGPKFRSFWNINFAQSPMHSHGPPIVLHVFGFSEFPKMNMLEIAKVLQKWLCSGAPCKSHFGMVLLNWRSP